VPAQVSRSKVSGNRERRAWILQLERQWSSEIARHGLEAVSREVSGNARLPQWLTPVPRAHTLRRQMLKRTPFYDFMCRWAPNSSISRVGDADHLPGIIDEHEQDAQQRIIFDVSHMGRCNSAAKTRQLSSATS